MTFTSTPPTTPGFYAWRLDEFGVEFPVRLVRTPQGLSSVLFAFAKTAEQVGGQWCKLVPADEIEKTWIESYDDVIGIKGTALPTERWLKSRAKRVMEGLE